jgi:uncharacterized protein YggU (UPF0235/DUF167 family)
MKHIKIKVYPEAKKEVVEQKHKDQFNVFLREKAQDNMANKGLIRVMASHLNLTPQDLRIVSGHRTRSKILEVFSDREL